MTLSYAEVRQPWQERGGETMASWVPSYGVRPWLRRKIEMLHGETPMKHANALPHENQKSWNGQDGVLPKRMPHDGDVGLLLHQLSFRRRVSLPYAHPVDVHAVRQLAAIEARCFPCGGEQAQDEILRN